MTSAPRSECGKAWLISMSIICPISRACDAIGAGKLTTRLFSVRPDSSDGSLRDGPSTSTRSIRPTIDRLSANTLGFDRRLQHLEPLELDLVRRIVAQVRGRRAGTRAVDERVARVVAHLVDERHELVESRRRSRRGSRRSRRSRARGRGGSRAAGARSICNSSTV